MATTVDDLIALKDQAVAACHAVVAAWERGNLADAANDCEAAVEASDTYDAAEADNTVASVEEYEEAHR